MTTQHSTYHNLFKKGEFHHLQKANTFLKYNNKWSFLRRETNEKRQNRPL